MGVDRVILGMSPPQARRAFPEKQVYEDWMGGNLNHCYLYHGLIFCFTKCDSIRPLPDSILDSIVIQQREDAFLCEEPMESWTLPTILKALAWRGYPTRRLPHGHILIAGESVYNQTRLCFDKADRLYRIEMDLNFSELPFCPPYEE